MNHRGQGVLSPLAMTNAGACLEAASPASARELPEALVVNPYDVEAMAATVRRAVTMSPAEQRESHAGAAAQVSRFQCLSLGGPHAPRRTPTTRVRQQQRPARPDCPAKPARTAASLRFGRSES
jgi:hypothetical protein